MPLQLQKTNQTNNLKQINKMECSIQFFKCIHGCKLIFWVLTLCRISLK